MQVYSIDRVIQYSLLSRLLQNPLKHKDIPVIKQAAAKLSPKAEIEINKIISILSKKLNDQQNEQALQVEYAHLFLLPEGVKPYESVYRSREPLMRQESWEQVKRFYRENGLAPDLSQLHPEDHASVELACMAYLAEHDTERTVQNKFLEQHLLQWLPDFLRDLKQNPYAEFYQLVAEFGQEFLETERILFDL